MMTLEEYRASVKREWDDAMYRQQHAKDKAAKDKAESDLAAACRKIDELINYGQW